MQVDRDSSGPALPAAPRIAVVTARLIGDALLTTPLIRAVRRRWPKASIDVFGYEGQLAALEGNPDIDRRVELPSSGGVAGIVRFVRTRRLWRRYDLALVTQASGRAQLLGWALAPTRAGIVRARAIGWHRLLRCVHAVDLGGDDSDRHVASENLALLQPWLGTPPHVRPAPVVIVPPAGSALPPDVARALRGRYCVVHVPVLAAAKAWPADRFAALVQFLQAGGDTVVLTGGASRHDRNRVDAVIGDRPAADGLVDVVGRLDFAQLVTLLEAACLYVGPDTSVTHLAAAVGVPVVALFGPGSPARWGPLGPTSDAAGYRRFSAAPQRNGNVSVVQGAPGAGAAGHPLGAAESIPLATVLGECQAALQRGAAPRRTRQD